jgi:hypothetical protein
MRASRGPKSMAIAVIGTEFLWLRKPRSLGKWSKTTTIGPESMSSVTSLVRFRPDPSRLRASG